jgi:dTMP kinase
LTLLIDVDLSTSLARAEARNRQRNRTDRMEEQDAAFYEKVRNAYSALAAAEPERFRVIDGRASLESVEKSIWETVSPYV